MTTTKPTQFRFKQQTLDKLVALAAILKSTQSQVIRDLLPSKAFIEAVIEDGGDFEHEFKNHNLRWDKFRLHIIRGNKNIQLQLCSLEQKNIIDNQAINEEQIVCELFVKYTRATKGIKGYKLQQIEYDTLNDEGKCWAVTGPDDDVNDIINDIGHFVQLSEAHYLWLKDMGDATNEGPLDE